MADTNSVGWNQVNKAVTSGTKKVVDTGKKVLETAAMATPVGREAKFAATIAKAGAEKVAAKIGERTAAKVGDKVAQKVAESIPAGRLGKAGGEAKSIKVNPDKDVTVSRTADKTKVVTTSPKKVEYTTPKNTPAQRQGVQTAQDVKRYNAIEGAQTNAQEAAKPVIGKAIVKTAATTAAGTAALAGAAGYAAGRASTPQPSASNNPVRPAGNSATKVHPDNKPATGNR
jgi:hypothetical protein